MWKIGEMNQIFLGTLSAIVIPLSACIRSSYRDLHDELTGDTGDTFGWLSPDFHGWWFGTCFIFPYPIGSMYAIYGNIYHQYTPNVSIYTIHGSYGILEQIIPTDELHHFSEGFLWPPPTSDA